MASVNKENIEKITHPLSLQAFLPLLKRAAQASSKKGLSCSKAAIVNVSSTLGSISKLKDMGEHMVSFPYNVSKV